jgi:iron complex transport system substrate-binding protein
MKRQLSVLLAAMLAMAMLLAGCGQEKTPQAANTANFAVLTDDLGRTVELKEKPAHFVVTSASFLEPLEAVGGADLVVGRPDSKTKMPDYAKDIASVGKVYQIDTEKVLACQPDLVIINKGMNEKLVDAMEKSGIKTLVLDMKSYEDVKREVVTLAELTGSPEKGQQLVKDMDDKIAAVKNSMPQGKSNCKKA